MISNPDQHIILVSGATGQQGGAVARHLLDRGFRVRALTRNPEQKTARALADRGAEIAEGNFDDRASLERALESAYGVYSVQNSFEAGAAGEIRQGKALAEAAKDAGARHFVYSSIGGAERETGLPDHEGKWEIEEHIRALGLPATILRPVGFMDNWAAVLKDAILGGQLPHVLSPSTKVQQIASDDIGGFAALAFSEPDKWIGRAVEIADDELPMAEIAETFSRVVGREVAYVQVPWDAFESQAGEEITELMRWIESDGYEADIEALREEYPDVKRLEPFLRGRNWTSE